MFERLKYKIGSLSIRVKLTVLFLVISIIPACIVGILSLRTARSTIIEHHSNEMKLRINKIANDLEQYIVNGVDYTSARLATHAGVRRLLGEAGEGYSPEQRESDRSALNGILLDNVYRKGTDSIMVFDRAGQQYTNDSTGVMNMLPLSSREVYEFNATSENIKIGRLLESDRRYYLPYIRKICYPTTTTVGYAVINIKLSGLDGIFSQMALESQSDIYIVDEYGDVISSNVKEAAGRRFSAIPEPGGVPESEGMLRIGGERYIYNARHNQKLNWTVYALKKESVIVAETKAIAFITIESVVLSLFICIMLAVLFSMTITKPIKKLIDDMNNFESSAKSDRFMTKYDDEIGKLGKSFALMTDKLEKSFEDIYTIEKAKREAEFKAFEAQINPHFLYNTLSSIISLIECGRSDEAVEVVNLLSAMFRELIGRGAKSKITIEQEFNHVISYVNIQQMRYRNQFNCIYLVDEVLTKYYTIRLILQPLVENAIYHGVKNLDGGGVIKMIGYTTGNDVILEVWDNGGHVDDEKIHDMNASLESLVRNAGFGMGIRNVHSRIRHFYGGIYGLDFRQEGAFTVARVRIPVDKGGAEFENTNSRR